jgi:hypothetical protein
MEPFPAKGETEDDKDTADCSDLPAVVLRSFCLIDHFSGARRA